MLPRPTLRKIVREIFATEGETAGLSIPADKQLNWLKRLAKKLSKIDRVDAKVRDFYIALKVSAGGAGGRDIEWFMVNFFPYDGMQVKVDRSGLWIADATYRRRRKAETETPVLDVAHLEKFVEAIKEKQDRAKLRAQRNSKLNGLKQRGLKSRLTELGAEHGFSFCLGESKRDINLSIRVCGKKSAYHFAFPKGKLDAVLDQVPDLIQTLEELRSLGINFRTHNKRWEQGPWVEPKSSSKA